MSHRETHPYRIVKPRSPKQSSKSASSARCGNSRLGFRYATLVSVTLRVDGEPVGRLRELMAIFEDVNGLGLGARENEED
jgi:hypothetical protein